MTMGYITFKVKELDEAIREKLVRCQETMDEDAFAYQTNDEGFTYIDIDSEDYAEIFDEWITFLKARRIPFDALKTRINYDGVDIRYRPGVRAEEDVCAEMLVHPFRANHYLDTSEVMRIIENEADANVAVERLKELMRDYADVTSIPPVESA